MKNINDQPWINQLLESQYLETTKATEEETEEKGAPKGDRPIKK